MFKFCPFFFFFLLERVYEEHELLVDNLMLWTRDSKNRLLFVERPERTLIFENPSLFSDNRQQSPSHATNNFAQVCSPILKYISFDNTVNELHKIYIILFVLSRKN